MRALRAALADARTSAQRWRYLPYDQLHLRFAGPADGVLLVECPAKAARRPYHQQKLAWILTQQRHFAVEAAQAGLAVRYVVADSYADAVAALAAEVGPVEVCEPAERELRHELAPLVADGRLRVAPHPGWLTTAADLPAGPPWRQDGFYRRVRQRTGWLMEGGSPVGGKYSLDAENREPWRGLPPAPEPPRVAPDPITQEVGELIRRRYAHHPGRLDLGAIPASAPEIEAWWRWALEACLPWFGPYEDAMSRRSRGLFHTRISPLLNLHRLWPADVVHDVLAADLPLSSQEGFLRQVVGWREFVRHVHVQTDGLRTVLPTAPGTDGGWSGWSGRLWPATPPDAAHPAAPGLPVPPALWGRPSGLRCLDDVVEAVWDEGWSHHITRLMVVGNLMTLLGVDARALTDWFWVGYIDAFDWVVEPNVLGMATWATPVMTSKPYVAGAAYLDRMGDACASCRFRPGKDCPVTPMYWAWIGEHAAELDGNARMWGPLAGWRRRTEAQRAADLATRDAVRRALAAGAPVTPELLRAR